MGCGQSKEPLNSFSAKVTPGDTDFEDSSTSVITVVSLAPVVPTETDGDNSTKTGLNLLSSEAPLAVQPIQRPITRSSSAGSMLDNAATKDPYSWYSRNNALNRLNRRIVVDTTRAKSNQPLVSACCEKLGFEEKITPNSREESDVYWHNIVYSDLNRTVTSSHSRVNKFPAMNELAKKIPLTHAISSMQKIFPTEYDFYPNSWFLPAHLSQFEEYVADPMLMSDGLKFDLRVYGVIKSINPLSIYVAREGMARFCTEKYERPTTGNFDNLFAHLTNYSLNKSSESYVHSNSLQEQMKGSKRLLSTVFHQLEARGVRTKKLWHDIKMIIVKTTLAMLPEMMLHYENHFFDSPGPQCFQIVGYDVMIRSDGTPILLEVNAAPSLVTDHMVPLPGKTLLDGGTKVRSIVDEVIKFPLVRDTLLLVMGLMDDVYGDDRTTNNGKTVDDFQFIKQKRKPHLSEIFPTRYGAHSAHLLFLDKVMYIFMHFVHLRYGVYITMSGLKHFVSLVDIIELQDVDEKMEEIMFNFVGDFKTNDGMPFHAFLAFFFFVAESKYPHEVDLLAKLQRLISHCDMNLRHYGVRSARLRRTEVGTKKNGRGTLEFYMLPGRMRMKSEMRKDSRNPMDHNNNPNNLSLPKINSRY